MTKKSPSPRITGIVLSDGLDTYDPIAYDAKNAPNSSEHKIFMEYYEAEFLKILQERVSFVENILNEHSTGALDIKGLEILLASAPEPALYYAAKYMLHKKLVDHFKQQGQELSAAREFYLLGATWAEARFMVNYRDVAHTGRKFMGKKTDRATNQRERDGSDVRRKLIGAARQELGKGKGLKKNGTPNISALADLCKSVCPNISKSRIRHILSEAKDRGEMANRPTK